MDLFQTVEGMLVLGCGTTVFAGLWLVALWSVYEHNRQERRSRDW